MKMKKITFFSAVIVSLSICVHAQTPSTTHTNISKTGKKVLPKSTSTAQQSPVKNSSGNSALNPQPLPPKTHVLTQRELPTGSSGNSSLNPQSLPPKTHIITQKKSLKSSVNNGALNPQPLPPRTATKSLQK
jgi:hypothetical protein